MRLTRLLVPPPGRSLAMRSFASSVRRRCRSAGVVLNGTPFQIVLKGGSEPSAWYEVRTATGDVLAAGPVDRPTARIVTGLVVSSGDELPLTVLIGDTSHEVDATLHTGDGSRSSRPWSRSLALLFREVVTALFAGVWLGALAWPATTRCSATGD